MFEVKAMMATRQSASFLLLAWHRLHTKNSIVVKSTALPSLRYMRKIFKANHPYSICVE